MAEYIAVLDYPNLLAGLLSGALLVWLAIWIGRKHKTLRYSYSSQQLVKRTSKWAERKVKVMVDAKLLEPNADLVGDGDELTEVDEVYGSTLLVRNVGNEIAEDFEINVTLGGEAAIVEHFTEPENSEAYPLYLESGADKAKIRVPYLNDKTELVCGLVYVGKAGEKVSVEVVGKGVRLKRPIPEALTSVAAVAGLLAVMFGSLYLLNYLEWSPWLMLLTMALYVAFLIYQSEKNERSAPWERGT